MTTNIHPEQEHQDGGLPTTMDHGPLTSSSQLVRPRTRNVLHTVIQSALEDPSRSSVSRGDRTSRTPKASTLIQDNASAPAVVLKPLLFGKTWNIYKTTPFYNFDIHLHKDYGAELLAFVAANASNMSSSMLTERTHVGMSTFFSGDRRFPSQIDGSGRNVVDTLDDPGDISNIEFHQLALDDDTQSDNDNTPQGLQDPNTFKYSLIITITVRPKGKTREQQYHCAVLRDQLYMENKKHSGSSFTHFNLVLFKAPAAMCQLVMQWLERKFDCRICRLLLQPYELRTIVDSSLEIMYNQAQGRGDKKDRPIELHYSFPGGVDALKSMSVSLPVDDARQLLVSREDGSSAGILDGIEAHCSDAMMIDFGRLVLTRAGCSSWYIACEGKVKIFPAIVEKHSVVDFIRQIGRCGT